MKSSIGKNKKSELHVLHHENFDIFLEKKDNYHASNFIELKNKNNQDNPFYIVKFDFDWKRNMVDIFQQGMTNNASILAFNVTVPGVFTGRKSKILHESISAVENILKQGVKPENIVLEGYCYCGAIATLTAKHFLDKGIRLNLYSDRSFAKVNSFFTKQKLEKTKDNQYFKKFMAKVCVSSLENLFYTVKGLRVEPGKAFTSLYQDNPDRTQYTVFRGEKSTNTGKLEDDFVVAYELSIHSYLRDLRKSAKAPIKETILFIDEILKNNQVPSLETFSEFLSQKKDVFQKAVLESCLKEKGDSIFDQGIKLPFIDKDILQEFRKELYVVQKDITHFHKVQKLYTDDYYKEKLFSKILSSNIEKYSRKLNDHMLQEYMRAIIKDDAPNRSDLLKSKLSDDKFFKELYTISENTQAEHALTKDERAEILSALKEKWLKEFIQLPWYKESVINNYHSKLGHHTPQWELYSRAFQCPVQVNNKLNKEAIKEQYKQHESDIDFTNGFFEDFIYGVKELNTKAKINAPTLQKPKTFDLIKSNI